MTNWNQKTLVGLIDASRKCADNAALSEDLRKRFDYVRRRIEMTLPPLPSTARATVQQAFLSLCEVCRDGKLCACDNRPPMLIECRLLRDSLLN